MPLKTVAPSHYNLWNNNCNARLHIFYYTRFITVFFDLLSL